MQSTLAGDVLLLAVGDQARYLTKGPVAPVVAAAVFCDRVLGGSPIVLPPGVDLARVFAQGDPYFAETAGALCRAGLLAPYEHRALGLFPRRTGHRVVRPEARDGALSRLAGIARIQPPGHEREPDRATAALTVLCGTSGISRSTLGTPRRMFSGAMADRFNGFPALLGPELTDVLFALRRAYDRADPDPANPSFVPYGALDGYGDVGGLGETARSRAGANYRMAGIGTDGGGGGGE